MKEIIYCVEILKQKHELLVKSKKYFYEIQQFENCAYIRDEEKQIEVIIKKLLKEFKSQMNNLDSVKDKELIIRYDKLIYYFDLDYESKKADLEQQLTEQKNKLKSLSILFNFRIANKVRENIRTIESDLRKVNKRLSHENE